eukprot:jgi/Tetstr1/431108/TSEL_020824.t1
MGVVHILANLTFRSPLLMTELRKLWFILDSNDTSIRARCIKNTSATVIVPYWPNRGWHQRLSEMVSEVVVFPPSLDRFAPGRLGVRTGIGPPKWPVVAFQHPLRARCRALDI